MLHSPAQLFGIVQQACLYIQTRQQLGVGAVTKKEMEETVGRQIEMFDESYDTYDEKEFYNEDDQLYIHDEDKLVHSSNVEVMKCSDANKIFTTDGIWAQKHTIQKY